MANAIELEHVGPIEHLTIPIPDGGGVVVLRGRNGSGKSHALNGVEALYSKDARKSLRNSDGVPSGSIEGLGVTVRLGRTNTARGELVCESLDGRIDPSQLVDPGLKDPLAADSRRLATLIRLSGVKIQPEQWVALCGDAADELAVGSLIDSDPVVTADKIRRRLHDLALSKERLSESKTGEAATLRKSVADVDVSVDSNEQGLAAAISAATVALTKAESQRDQATKMAKARHDAMRKLEELREGALSVEEAAEDKDRINADAVEAAKRAAAAQASVVRAEELLASAKQALRDANVDASMIATKHQDACKRFDLAKAQAAQLLELEQSISDVLIEPPSEQAIADLVAERDRAIAASQQGEVVRRAKSQLRKADLLADIAAAEAKTAEVLRQRARSTDTVLEEALVAAGFDTIKVHDGRLCIDSDRGLEPFSELSHGERWKFALDLAARGLPKGAVLPVCQEAFEALDPANREFVSTLARERGLVIVTAEATDGDLRAEVL